MKLPAPIPILFAALLLVQPTFAATPTEIESASPKSRIALDLYAQAKDPKPVAQVKTAELRFPLRVDKTQSGYLSVSVNGQQYWIRSVQVRLKKASSARCPPTIVAMRQTASTPGVGSANCQ